MLQHLAEKHRRLEEQVKHHEQIRRALHNQVVELKGNIRVYVRVRPPLDGESSQLPYQFVDTGVGQGDDSRAMDVIYKKVYSDGSTLVVLKELKASDGCFSYLYAGWEPIRPIL